MRNRVIFGLLSALSIIFLFLVPIHGDVLGGPLIVFLLMGLTANSSFVIFSSIVLLAVLSSFLAIFIRIPKWLSIVQLVILFIGLGIVWYLLVIDPTSRIGVDTIVISILFMVFSLVNLVILLRKKTSDQINWKN